MGSPPNVQTELPAVTGPLPRPGPPAYGAAMILIAGTVRFPPENMAEARPAMARMVTATRSEDGCLQYAFAEDVLDPGLIHISELWRDAAALEAHGAAAHMAAWRAEGAALGIHGRDLRFYEVEEPFRR